MNAKKIKKGVTGLVLGLMIMGQTASAATWYSSTITLPRNDFWYTTARTSTQATQKLRVNKPTYDVVTMVAKSNKTRLTNNKTHKAKSDTTQSHTSSVKGASIRGAFRSSIVNQFTNTVNLSWQP